MRHLAILVCLALAAGAHAQAADEIMPPPPEGPIVDVVFVLDTTGSMSGLIQAAKEKVWAIANTLALADPTPEIRMGLVGYRDRSDEYVTRVTDLTDDLDAVYGKLMEFTANGGGDTPESVNQALHEAVTKLDWSKEDDTYRVIFLVGDAPPHMDYEQDVKYPATCKKAAKKGIFVNTIQCGDISSTAPIWREIAAKAEGKYFRVEQSGNAILAGTPFDEELDQLASQMEGTRLYYGSAAVQAEMAERVADSRRTVAAAPVAAKAARASFSAKAAGMKNFAGKNELVLDYSDGKVALDDLEEAELPAEMKGKSKEEQQAHLEKMAKDRKELVEKIEALSKKRQAHIKQQLEKSNLDKKGTFDYSVFECIQTQAAKKGLTYKEDGPAL
ncbi:MAG: VWA domain-containing protein [bacterium]|nr:VWA domain-containing protein [bacterium]